MAQQGRQPFLLVLRLAFCVLLVSAAFSQTRSAGPAAPAKTADPASLIGMWEARDHFEEDLALTIVFSPGGAVSVSSGVLTSFQVHVVKGEIVAELESLSGFPQEVHIRVAGNRMTYISGHVTEQWVRVGNPVEGQPAWAGAWVFESAAPSHKHKGDEVEGLEEEQSMKGNMRMVINPDGKGRLRLPVNTENGTYTVEGNKLHIKYPDRVSDATWRLDGNTLYLGNPAERTENAFDRIQ